MCATHILGTEFDIKFSTSTIVIYFVYIVRCKDNTLYTGFTRNIKQRIYQHNSGFRGAKSLRGKKPVRLVHLEQYKTITEALKREKEIKTWKKNRKEELIESENAPALKSAAFKRE